MRALELRPRDPYTGTPATISDYEDAPAARHWSQVYADMLGLTPIEMVNYEADPAPVLPLVEQPALGNGKLEERYLLMDNADEESIISSLEVSCSY